MEKIISNVKERVLQIAEKKGVAKERFFEEIGMTYGSFKGAAKNTPLNSDAIANIISKYPDISAEWLLTGKQPMLKTSEYNEPEKIQAAEKVEIYSKAGRLHQEQSVPLYDMVASAGLVELFDGTQDVLGEISIPNLPKCDGAIKITGDSMYPILKSGDIVMYQRVTDIKEGIFWGEMYIVQINMGGGLYMTSVKYIQKSDKGDDHVKLVSQNKNHDPKDVKMSKIRGLAFVKASIRINSIT
jgi:phage repressor protein C with HTH and peptisase S24 domain